MATTSNLSSIIRFYAEKQNSPFIDFKNFCIYIKKYAEHHLEEQGELVKYLGDPAATVIAELQGLSEKKIAALSTINNKRVIISLTYFAVMYAQLFKKMLEDPAIPYPTTQDAPKNFPVNAFEKVSIRDYITSLTVDHNAKSTQLFILEFSKQLPPMIMPACVPLNVIMETAQQKIRKILSGEEFRDYYLKKLRSTNPTKELAIQSFFQNYIIQPEHNFKDVSDGDEYYLWAQLCYYIKQDFEKVQDKTADDVKILQAVEISEVYNSYLKQKFQDSRKRDEALRQLELELAKAPYFFSMNQILKFQDNAGHLLYGQFSQEDLQEFIRKMTTEGNANELPPLVIFKTDSTKYYIYKQKVLQLTIRLCNEAHDAIEQTLVKKWYSSLLDYKKLPEMTNSAAFERALEILVQEKSPVLWGLLTANFMTLLPYEKEVDPESTSFHIFNNGKLIPLSDLLMVNNEQIYSKARARLPVTYTIPILSWIMSLINANKKKKVASEKTKIIKNDLEDSILNDTELPQHAKASSSGKKQSKTSALSNKAKDIAKELIPEGSTIDRELDYLCKEWNMMLTKENKEHLTEDVNSLIRDYTRKVTRTLTATTFTKERIENLAVSLARTPSMQKIKNQEAITEYIQLYMLRLVTNFEQ